MIRRLGAALVLFTLLAVCARAQTQGTLYGGRGDEAILGAVPCEGGLFAVGYTYSSDGDLSMRTRTGKTGWALRLDAQGEVVFSACSAHVGRDEMTSPFAHADGTFSCLLRGEEKGAEWLRLSGEGKVTARIELPEIGQFCPHDAGAAQGRRMFFEEKDGASLALEAIHADGTSCMAAMNEDGAIRPGAVFQDGMDRVCVPLAGGSGQIAALYTQDAQAVMTWVAPGGESEPRVMRIPITEGVLEWIVSAISCEDGSVIFSGQLAGGDGVIARVSRSGEAVFSVRTSNPGWRMALTDMGFAALTTQEILFFSEDGALQGIQPIRLQMDFPDECILSAYGSGVALIESLTGSKTRQISVTAVAEYSEAAKDVYAGIDNLHFLRMGSEIIAAQAEQQGILLSLRDQDGQSESVLITSRGDAQEIGYDVPAQPDQGWALPDGRLEWAAEPYGTWVSRVDAQGNLLFKTRVAIHTAADSAQWLCMTQAGGEYLLGGRYLTQEGAKARQEAVVARIGADGILREIRTVEGLGCVCAMLRQGENVLLLGAASPWPRMEADVLTKLGSEPYDWQPLSVFIDARRAWLFPAGEGSVYVAGTSRRNGRTAAVLHELRIP